MPPLDAAREAADVDRRDVADAAAIVDFADAASSLRSNLAQAQGVKEHKRHVAVPPLAGSAVRLASPAGS